jgi:hypothetical protein
MGDFSILGKILTETGYGGAIVFIVIFACLAFSGSLIVWIARGKEE